MLTPRQEQIRDLLSIHHRGRYLWLINEVKHLRKEATP
jgi:hypothetical protein